jgi:hypothetical protein
VKAVRKASGNTKIYMYADYMVLAAEDNTEVQTALKAIEKLADENKFTINGSKTVQMTFRKGGRRATEDTITLRNKPLESVNDFKYLGMTLQTTISSIIQVTHKRKGNRCNQSHI